MSLWKITRNERNTLEKRFEHDGWRFSRTQSGADSGRRRTIIIVHRTVRDAPPPSMTTIRQGLGCGVVCFRKFEFKKQTAFRHYCKRCELVTPSLETLKQKQKSKFRVPPLYWRSTERFADDDKKRIVRFSSRIRNDRRCGLSWKNILSQANTSLKRGQITFRKLKKKKKYEHFGYCTLIPKKLRKNNLF